MGGRAAALGIGLAVGCGGDAFVCLDDQSCEQGGAQGVCQANGYCSFPDPDCPSGQRYGEHAPGALANNCVVEAGTGDSDGSDGSATGSTTTNGTRGSTTGPSTDSTTVSLDGPTVTGPGDTTADSTVDPTAGTTGADDASGTTTAGGVACWNDDFADEVLDPQWCTMTDSGLEVSESGGRLRVSFIPAQWGAGSEAARAMTCDPFPLLGSTASVELVGVPAASPWTEAFIELGHDALRVGAGVIDDTLEVFVFDGAGYAVVSTQPYSPQGQRYLRIMGTDLGLEVEHSPDAVAWVPVHTVPTDLVGIEGVASLGGFASSVPLGSDEAVFDSWQLCPGE